MHIRKTQKGSVMVLQQVWFLVCISCLICLSFCYYKIAGWRYCQGRILFFHGLCSPIPYYTLFVLQFPILPFLFFIPYFIFFQFKEKNKSSANPHPFLNFILCYISFTSNIFLCFLIYSQIFDIFILFYN